MNFTDDLHFCPICRDFVPYIPAVEGASCSECGRLFTEADEFAYRRFRRWAFPGREERPPSHSWASSPLGRWLPGDALTG